MAAVYSKKSLVQFLRGQFTLNQIKARAFLDCTNYWGSLTDPKSENGIKKCQSVWFLGAYNGLIGNKEGK